MCYALFQAPDILTHLTCTTQEVLIFSLLYSHGILRHGSEVIHPSEVITQLVSDRLVIDTQALGSQTLLCYLDIMLFCLLMLFYHYVILSLDAQQLINNLSRGFKESSGLFQTLDCVFVNSIRKSLMSARIILSTFPLSGHIRSSRIELTPLNSPSLMAHLKVWQLLLDFPTSQKENPAYHKLAQRTMPLKQTGECL